MVPVVAAPEADVLLAALDVVDVEPELPPPHPAMASVATTTAGAPDWLRFLNCVGTSDVVAPPAASPAEGFLAPASP
jgi:hypothetical protein